MPLPLHIFEERYKTMIGMCIEEESEFGVVYYDGSRLSRKGCTAKISEILKRYEDGRMDILTLGQRRFTMQNQYDEKPYMEADVTYFTDQEETLDDSFADLAEKGIAKLNELAQLAERQLDARALAKVDLSVLSFIIAANDAFTMAEKQRFLEMTSTRQRLRRGIASLDHLVERARVSAAINKLIGGNGHFRGFFEKR
jgi:ATP-dependent Lon protease